MVPGATSLAPAQLRHLMRRYGGLAADLLDLTIDEPRLADPLVGAEKYLAAEVRYAALHERALHVDDVLTRCTHIAFEAANRGDLAAEHVARLMAPVLGWDRAVVEREIARYRARLRAERAAQSTLDDAASDAARSPLRDLRLSVARTAVRLRATIGSEPTIEVGSLTAEDRT